ncbi:MAG TPA: ATPase, T2SS/T4P/T4SS family [Gaiellaceae bacterium]|nr:ATPase, T2SS/T4P/T4SS family [Gaiellaceae bacterium]
MSVQPLPAHPAPRAGEGRPLLGGYLMRKGQLTAEGLEQALAEQEQTGLPLGQVLIGLGLITTSQLAEVLAEQHTLEYVDLGAFKRDEHAVTQLPESLARRYHALPIAAEADGTVVVAVADPTNLLAHDDLRLALGTHTRIVVADSALLDETIDRAYKTQQIGSVETFSGAAWRANEDADDQISLDDTAPAIKIVNDVIARALAHRASDIHFEPQADRLVVRLRVDGVTRQLTEIETSMQAAVLARLKVMGGVDIAQRRTPQDGRVGIRVGGRPMDLRLAILPTTYGEQAVLRILQGGAKGPLGLDELGMDHETETVLRRAIERPYGAIITVGPTGSGKTTTLYAALEQLNDPGRVIVTIEDPVEYQMPGAGQIEIDPPAGLTFARGLRTILRSDPDVILVGEIRDEETARIAMQAATTGHLVLSTLHAQSASSSIVRLKDMGVDPGLLAPSLNCIVAQRLARRLCLKCREAYAPRAEELERFGIEKTPGELYRAVGCEACLHTGFEGRVALYEAMSVEGKIRRLIDATTEEIFAAAIEQGMITLRDSGIKLALAGVTSLDEIHRVTGDRLL